MDFIEEHREGPFFAYFPTSLPHRPFHWPPGRRGSDEAERAGAEQAQFEAMVHHLDKLVGRIVAKIDALGLTEETLILFTGDNGSPAGIRSQLHGQVISGGKGQTTEAGMRVPLVARMPGTVPAGAVSDDLVGFSDVLPTLADLAGAPMPAGPIDGVSVAPQLRGQQGAARPWLFSYYAKGPYRSSLGEAKRFAWDQQWKLYSDGRLFHVAEDPREETAISIRLTG